MWDVSDFNRQMCKYFMYFYHVRRGRVDIIKSLVIAQNS